MQQNHVLRALGALIFLCVGYLCIVPETYSFLLNYFNSKGILGSGFQLLVHLLMMVLVLIGIISPFADAIYYSWRTKEEKYQAWFITSTSLNFGFLIALLIGMIRYNTWQHRPENNLIVVIFWLTLAFAGSINMMRSTSKTRFKGLYLIRDDT
jgi:cell division protein FtsW (lipid II flippase)